MAADLPTDEDLIASIRAKDVQALEAFYDRYRVLVYSLALRVLGNPRDAEDVIQEVFLNIWRSAGTYNPQRSTGRSWLLSVVHHRAIDKLRARQSRPQSVPMEMGLNAASSSNVWRDVSDNLTGEVVRDALLSLPREQARTIELAYFEGYSQHEIAESMQVPLGTVKGRMRLALQKLRTTLDAGRLEPELE